MSISLAMKAPHLIQEWSPENGDLTPDQVTYGSNKKAWWQGTCGHSWQAIIKNRVNGHGCPICTGNIVVPGVNDLGTVALDIAKEWSDKNLPQTPEQYAAHSPRYAWWKCRTCHQEWRARIADRVDGHGCPVCSGAKLVAGINDLATEFPVIAKEWSAKNARAPNEYWSRATDNVWWHCGKCGEEWQGVIRARIRGRECPNCRKLYHGLSLHERIMKYAGEENLTVELGDDSAIGIPLQYYFPKEKAAIRISKRTDYYPQEIKREYARNRMCRMSGIKLIRILYPGADEMPDCICISRQDNTWEADEMAARVAIMIIAKK